jgi:hypothetical protein
MRSECPACHIVKKLFPIDCSAGEDCRDDGTVYLCWDCVNGSKEARNSDFY